MARKLTERLRAYWLVAWRVMGSPRVPALERAFGSIARIPANPSLPRSTSVKYVGFAAGGVVALTLVTWVGVALAGGDPPQERQTPTSTPAIQYLTEIEALEFALAAARDKGLAGNFAHIARRIRLLEYAEAVGEANRARQGYLEAPADTEVWAIAFAGDVQVELSTGDVVGFDNITVVVDALTGQVFRVEAFYGDFESPARAPVWLRPPPTTTPPQ